MSKEPKMADERRLSDEELEKASGGKGGEITWWEDTSRTRGTIFKCRFVWDQSYFNMYFHNGGCGMYYPIRHVDGTCKSCIYVDTQNIYNK